MLGLCFDHVSVLINCWQIYKIKICELAYCYLFLLF
ncbi:hypothetical protein C357_12429 [Citreicella sp. 357]|nr:hypothetical protein C357_12429 [Citreicella sp. 357]